MAIAFLMPCLAFAFSNDYKEARIGFRTACAEKIKTQTQTHAQTTAQATAIQGYCRQYKVASSSDDDLTIDFGYFRRNGNTRLLVLQSGIHGSEAPAGSFVEQLFMKKYLNKYLENGTDVLLIHALNPWGFKNLRRVDEMNVNLNRNFGDEKLYSNVNQAYAELRDLFEPQGSVGSWTWASLKIQFLFVKTLILSGFNKGYISAAMNAGQYKFDHGLNFGGFHPSVQVGFLRELMTPLLAAYPKHILFLDLHTGLGENGVLQLISSHNRLPKAFYEQFAAKLQNYANQSIKLIDPKSPGFFENDGDVCDFVGSLAPNSENILALTAEYGTLGLDTRNQLKSAVAMVLENQAHYNSCFSSDVCDQIQRTFREVFNPTAPEWRQQILGEASQLFEALASGY